MMFSQPVHYSTYPNGATTSYSRKQSVSVVLELLLELKIVEGDWNNAIYGEEG